ncbi:MAG: hypothetical protein UMU75_09820 [Halomonas sp.]|nr:hypothetical protein [Halomonas sp.]
MRTRRWRRSTLQRLKLMALITLFLAPLAVAWSMLEWRVGIPSERVAHGRLMPSLPTLDAWPLAEPRPLLASLDWVLAYDCRFDCPLVADRWWRLHRALGREAPRLTRLRLGGQDAPLPGEVVGQWQIAPAWTRQESLWVIDPAGQVVLSYRPHHDANEVLEDLRRLLRMNPEPAMAPQE